MIPRGMPGPLPEGETLLWSGAPDWRVLARSGLHARKLAIYFALIAVWTGASSLGQGVGPAALAFLKAAGFGAIPVALAVLYAWVVSRSTVYTITNRRVVLHIGLALPVTLNLPFQTVASADVRGGANGSGDLSLTLTGADRFAYVVLWPHARPWRYSPAQPTLRGLADVGQPAQTLARALASLSDQPVSVISDTDVSAKSDTNAFLPRARHANVAA